MEALNALHVSRTPNVATMSFVTNKTIHVSRRAVRAKAIRARTAVFAMSPKWRHLQVVLLLKEMTTFAQKDAKKRYVLSIHSVVFLAGMKAVPIALLVVKISQAMTARV